HLFREPDSYLTKLRVFTLGQDVLAREGSRGGGLSFGREFFDAYNLGKVSAGTEATLEQVFLHVVDRVDLDSFFVEPLDVSTK
ncbi:hypothetical protein A2U01_0051672, partial [Trifolium medium]|nr:hypothetical protein [Trifolium medium]